MVRVEALSNRGLAWLIGFSHLWLENQVKARLKRIKGTMLHCVERVAKRMQHVRFST